MKSNVSSWILRFFTNSDASSLRLWKQSQVTISVKFTHSSAQLPNLSLPLPRGWRCNAPRLASIGRKKHREEVLEYPSSWNPWRQNNVLEFFSYVPRVLKQWVIDICKLWRYFWRGTKCKHFARPTHSWGGGVSISIYTILSVIIKNCLVMNFVSLFSICTLFFPLLNTYYHWNRSARISHCLQVIWGILFIYCSAPFKISFLCSVYNIRNSNL